MSLTCTDCTAIKLAIVDDHQLFRRGLRYILAGQPGCEVVLEAASGSELFAALLTGCQPDVVLLDLHLPGMDGRQISQALLAQYPRLRIIMLSMDHAPHFILELLRLGVHAYLPKDSDPDRLGQAIEQVHRQGYYIDDTIAQTMRDGLQAGSSPAPAPVWPAAPTVLLSELTTREREVLGLLCQGYSSADIAARLFISLRTVEGHRTRLLEKTGTGNAVSLVIFAMRHQLV